MGVVQLKGGAVQLKGEAAQEKGETVLLKAEPVLLKRGTVQEKGEAVQLKAEPVLLKGERDHLKAEPAYPHGVLQVFCPSGVFSFGDSRGWRDHREGWLLKNYGFLKQVVQREPMLRAVTPVQ